MDREEKLIVIIFMSIFFIAGLVLVFMPMDNGENVNMEKITCEKNGYHYYNNECHYNNF